MKSYKRVLLFFCLILTLQSCTPVILEIFGMKKLKELSKKEITKQAKSYGIPEQDSYELDSSYATYLFALDSLIFQNEQKNHFQPLQVLYYSRSGQLLSFHINCNAGGFPNLKWNRFGILDEFVPKSQTPVDTIFSLSKQLEFLHPLEGSARTDLSEYDYVIVVHWSRFMGRQSKRLIRFVQKNASLNANFKTKILYVNNDNLFSYSPTSTDTY